MTQIWINELGLSYPEGFHEMSEEERSKLNFLVDGPGACLTDSERHVTVSVGWKKSALASVMISAEEAAKRTEQNIRKAMIIYGYELEGFQRFTLGGERATGYRYSYTAKDIGMTAETIVVKHNKVFYYLNFYARTELLGESLKAWKGMLDSAKFKD